LHILCEVTACHGWHEAGCKHRLSHSLLWCFNCVQVRAFLLSLHHLQHSGEIQLLHRSATESLVAALFKVTFLGEQARSDGAAADCIATWIEEKVQEAKQLHAGAGDESDDSWETDSADGSSGEYESEAEH